MCFSLSNNPWFNHFCLTWQWEMLSDFNNSPLTHWVCIGNWLIDIISNFECEKTLVLLNCAFEKMIFWNFVELGCGHWGNGVEGLSQHPSKFINNQRFPQNVFFKFVSVWKTIFQVNFCRLDEVNVFFTLKQPLI